MKVKKKSSLKKIEYWTCLPRIRCTLCSCLISITPIDWRLKLYFQPLIRSSSIGISSSLMTKFFNSIICSKTSGVKHFSSTILMIRGFLRSYLSDSCPRILFIERLKSNKDWLWLSTSRTSLSSGGLSIEMMNLDSIYQNNTHSKIWRKMIREQEM